LNNPVRRFVHNKQVVVFVEDLGRMQAD
jgi:hypothetical protein